MRIADHRKIIFHYWVWLHILVVKIKRNIRCFIASEIFSTTNIDSKKYLSLILNLSWLYFVDAVISIKQFKIIIKNASKKKSIKEVTESELVFCVDHNLLMYFKTAISRIDKTITIEDVNKSKIEFFASDASDNDSNDEKFLIHSMLLFQWVLSMTKNCTNVSKMKLHRERNIYSTFVLNQSWQTLKSFFLFFIFKV